MRNCRIISGYLRMKRERECVGGRGEREFKKREGKRKEEGEGNEN